MSDVNPNVYWEEHVVPRNPEEYDDWCAEYEDYLNDKEE